MRADHVHLGAAREEQEEAALDVGPRAQLPVDAVARRAPLTMATSTPSAVSRSTRLRTARGVGVAVAARRCRPSRSRSRRSRGRAPGQRRRASLAMPVCARAARSCPAITCAVRPSSPGVPAVCTSARRRERSASAPSQSRVGCRPGGEPDGPVRRRLRPQPVPRPRAHASPATPSPTSTRPAARRRRSACSTPSRDYLVDHNTNIHGFFATSEETDAMILEAASRRRRLPRLRLDRGQLRRQHDDPLLPARPGARRASCKPGDEIVITRARPRGQPRSLAAPRGARRRGPRGPGRPGHLHARLGGLRAARATPGRTQGRRRRLRLQRGGHGQRRGAGGEAGPRRRRLERRRRRALRAARPHRRQGHRLRLPALLRLQVLRPAHRPHVRAARRERRACRAAAAAHAGAGAALHLGDRHAGPRGYGGHHRRHRLHRRPGRAQRGARWRTGVPAGAERPAPGRRRRHAGRRGLRAAAGARAARAARRHPRRDALRPTGGHAPHVDRLVHDRRLHGRGGLPAARRARPSSPGTVTSTRSASSRSSACSSAAASSASASPRTTPRPSSSGSSTASATRASRDDGGA